MKEVEALLGYHKVNTLAYHSQTNGLVEHFLSHPGRNASQDT